MPTLPSRCALLVLVWLCLAVASFWSTPDATAAAPRVVVLIAEAEYETARTLPQWVEHDLKPLGVEATILSQPPDAQISFPGLAQALSEADVLLISLRRMALPQEQLAAIRQFIASGKAVMGIRTASHAFSLRDQPAPQGRALWPGFDVEVLGTSYQGHYSNDDGTEVSNLPHTQQHAIFAGVRQPSFHSGGTLYKSLELGPATEVLLRGTTLVDGGAVELPVAWTNRYGKSRVFYTSLGHPADFDVPAFRRILVNALFWCAGQNPPPATEQGDQAAAPTRDVYRDDLAGNEEVARIIRSYEGRGEVGDDSLPTPPDVALPQFQVRDGFELELVAAEPMVAQPLFMTWDERGRLWVVQYLQYPFPAGLKVIKYDQYLRAVFDKVPLPPPQGTPGADKVTVLEDTDGDGRYDHAKDVITGLNIASSVAIGGGGIWVLNPPYLLFYPDADRDDVPDGDPVVHLSGFGLEDTHSVANSLKFGPDGWLYGANGSTTTGTVSSAATRNVHFKGQCIWRYHPQTKIFEVFAEGGGNTFSLDFDAVGQFYSGTNNGGTRGMHYVQGGYANKNWGKHGPLTNPYAFGYYQHMRHEGFGERFPQTFTIYDGGAFGPEYEHTIITGNALHNRVMVSYLLPDTSSFRTVDRETIVVTSDRWFRPVDVETGPDGGVYIADWYDSRLSHTDPRDNWHKTSGRIYRLRRKDAPRLPPFDLARASSDELIALLDHDNEWFRLQAARLLAERDDPSILPQLFDLLRQPGPRAVNALWTLHNAGGFDERAALVALDHPDPNVRRWGARLVGDRREASASVAARLASLAMTEPDVHVRSQLASTAKRLSAEQGLPIVAHLLEHSEDAGDLHLPLLLWWAIESKAATDRVAVLALLEEDRVWDLPLVQDAIVARLAQRYAMTGEPDDLKTCADLLALAPSAAHQQRLMAGLLEAFQGRTITGLPPELSAAIEAYQRQLGQSDLALSLRLGSRDAVTQALAVVRDETADLPTRLTYLEILGQIDEPSVVAPLLSLLSSTPVHAVKRLALEALMNYDAPEIGQRVAGALATAISDEHDVRTTAFRVLASRRSWALELLDEIEQSRLKAQVVPVDIVAQMRLHGDPEIDRLVRKHWGQVRGATPAEKQQEIERLAALIGRRIGRIDAGQAVFTKHCGTCHKLFGEGGQTGPELTGYERDNLQFLLLAVVDPSAAIREEFTNFAVVTIDGRTLTGLIEDQTARTITLRGADNQTTLLDREDIDVLQAQSISLMPEGILQKLTEQEQADLLAYVTSRTPPRVLGEARAQVP